MSAAGNPYTPAPVAKQHHHHWWSKVSTHALPHRAHLTCLQVAAVEGLSQSRLDDLFADHHLGNYVAIRGSEQRIFESMPVAVRIGMQCV